MKNYKTKHIDMRLKNNLASLTGSKLRIHITTPMHWE